VWDPRAWVQARPSFPRAIAAPTAAPCDPPLVCVQFNQEYVPFVAGALSQLTQRTTWLAANEDTLQGILANMTWLIEIIGTAVQCSQPPQIGPTPAVRACNIAGYIANQVIRLSIEKALADIQADYDVLNYGRTILGFIPGAGGVFGVAMGVLYNLYNTIASGTQADFQAALDDPSYFGLVTCAIYQAIAAEGQVTTANFPTIVTNIDAVPYTLSDVKDAVHDYVTGLGAGGLQAIQPIGALADYDCGACSGTGPALGPVGPQPRQISGSDFLEIGIGFVDAVLPILFPTPFPSPPLLTVCADNQDLIASFVDTTATGTTLRLTAAVPVAATMSANIDWLALPPGTN
jgi:hypothetical protein